MCQFAGRSCHCVSLGCEARTETQSHQAGAINSLELLWSTFATCEAPHLTSCVSVFPSVKWGCYNSTLFPPRADVKIKVS